MWAISPDEADELEAMRAKKGLSFPTLMDPDLGTVRRYGVLNEDRPTVPHPTAVIVARDGEIAYLRVDENYRQRPEPEELLAALAALAEGPAGDSE